LLVFFVAYGRLALRFFPGASALLIPVLRSALMLAATKVDLDAKRVIPKDEINELHAAHHCPVVECSALTGQGVEDMWFTAARLAVEHTPST
jgi:Fe2+ transport system protein B